MSNVVLGFETSKRSGKARNSQMGKLWEELENLPRAELIRYRIIMAMLFNIYLDVTVMISRE